MRRSVSKLKQRRNVRRLRLRDRVRENSVVKKFGPKNNARTETHINVLVLDDLKQRRRASEPPRGVGEARSQDGAHATFPSLIAVPERASQMEIGHFEVSGGAAGEGRVGGSGRSEEKAQVKSKYVVPPLVQVAGSDECHGAETAGPEETQLGADAGSGEQAIGHRLPFKNGGLIERLPRPVGSTGEGRDSVEVSSVSYLSVPDTPASRRPSTADLVIEKLQEDDPQPLESENRKKNKNDHESSVVQMRIIGPSFLALGLLMLLLGCSFYGLARKISRDEKERRRKISEQQVSQLENSFSHAHSTSSPLHTATAPAVHQQYPILAVRRTSWWMDPTPIENPAPEADQTPERRDSTGHSPSPNGSLPSLMSPVPPEVKSPPLADIQGDIACFPPATNPIPSIRPTSATTRRQSAVERVHGGGQDTSRPTSVMPPSSATPGRSSVDFMPSDFVYYQNTGHMVPFIQVTAPPPTGPVLPRLSRHAATRMDSRPTTADSR
ncbi:uncharacterized protein LOC122257834 [Penaeus japonicus]|uniref:uncharacterized protein LOC122257834 n=1 Tax=Penaeus japonicus TaxID=27405 RepID=UPI001C70B05B|nr:uncharacterized protein LOC122257834 [Penaeus japonicus]